MKCISLARGVNQLLLSGTPQMTQSEGNYDVFWHHYSNFYAKSQVYGHNCTYNKELSCACNGAYMRFLVYSAHQEFSMFGSLSCAIKSTDSEDAETSVGISMGSDQETGEVNESAIVCGPGQNVYDLGESWLNRYHFIEIYWEGSEYWIARNGTVYQTHEDEAAVDISAGVSTTFTPLNAYSGFNQATVHNECWIYDVFYGAW